QGALALVNFRKAIFEGRIPKDEALDGVMILIAGAVLLTPGFLTDIFGFLLLLPSFRRPVGKWISRWVQKNVKIVSLDPRGPSAGSSGKPGPDADDGVIEAEAEIVDEKSPGPHG
ncbi:MAG: FxsA family protein, partial [Verrucomicrobiota bacterium]